MKKFAMVLALSLLPAAAMAQDNPQGPPPGGMRGPGRMQQNTIEWLLTQKQQFRPSEEQVTKLQALAKALTDSTAPLRDQMRQEMQAARNGGGNPGEAFQKIQPIREKIQHMDEEATEAAVKVLNEEQQKVVKDLLEAHKKEMQQRRPGFGGRPGGN